MAKRFNDFSLNFSLEKSFKEWLETMLQSRATSDYPSRLRRFFREEYPKLKMSFSHNGKEIYSLFGALIAQGASGRSLLFAFLDLCIAYSDEKKTMPQEDRAKFNNYLSALFSFQKFLLDLTSVLDVVASGKKGNLVTVGTGGMNVGGINIADVIVDLALHIGAFKEPGLNTKICDKACAGIYRRLQDKQLTVSAQVMRKKFISQFNTESRVSGDGILYPIDIIVPIINKHGTKGAVTNFWDKVIGNIKVIISEDGKDILFKDISSLIIIYEDDGMGQLVAVLRENKKATGERYNVYTEVYTGDGSKQYVPFRIKSTSQINRDHDEPIANVLAGLSKDEYPCLNTMTDAYRKSRSKKSRDVQNQLETLLNGKITSKYANGLYEEIKKLFRHLSFTLMEEHENKKKSNKQRN